MKKVYPPLAGFSLIEVLVVMFILGVVGIAIATFQNDIFSLNRILVSDLSSQQEVRVALKQISAELRSTSPSSTGAYAIAEASSTSLTFYSDIDDDGQRERMRYFLQNSILKRGVLKPSGNPLTYNPANETITNLVQGVYATTTPIFHYYNAGYDGQTTSMAQPVTTTNVRLVKITLTVDKNILEPPAPSTLTTQITLRNIKDNL